MATLDAEVDARCTHLVQKASRLGRTLQRKLSSEVRKLPAAIRRMSVNEFASLYEGDVASVVAERAKEREAAFQSWVDTVHKPRTTSSARPTGDLRYSTRSSKRLQKRDMYKTPLRRSTRQKRGEYETPAPRSSRKPKDDDAPAVIVDPGAMKKYPNRTQKRVEDMVRNFQQQLDDFLKKK